MGGIEDTRHRDTSDDHVPDLIITGTVLMGGLAVTDPINPVEVPIAPGKLVPKAHALPAFQTTSPARILAEVVASSKISDKACQPDGHLAGPIKRTRLTQS